MRCIPVGFLAVAILAGPVLAGPESGPENNVRLLDQACQTGDLETAEAQFTPGCWSRKWNSGEDFCGQAGRKRFNLVVVGTRVVGDRAVVTVDIAVKGKRVDQVYMYFVKEQGRWLIASLDENRHFVPLFLAGKLAPDFRARDLPPDAGLDEIGKLLLLASLDTGRVRSRVEERVSKDNLGDYLDKIAQLTGASYAGSHFEKSLGCGALAFKGGNEKLFLIVVRSPDTGKHRIVGHRYHSLANSSFLHGCR